jgi:hypothetical protein
MKMTVFWVVTPCGLVEIDRRFRSAYFPHHQDSKCPNDAVSIFETSVNFYRSTRCNNPEASHSQLQNQVTQAADVTCSVRTRQRAVLPQPCLLADEFHATDIWTACAGHLWSSRRLLLVIWGIFCSRISSNRPKLWLHFMCLVSSDTH